MISAAGDSTLRIQVDATNPGQFFACCGLLELADRLWGGAEGWFDGATFRLRPIETRESSLDGLVGAIRRAQLLALDTLDETASPIEIGDPFRLRLDWWLDRRSGGAGLKVWAGSMRGPRIARAMQQAMPHPSTAGESLFDSGAAVYDPDDTSKKVEPFYFDARRADNARALDIGFAPDALAMTSVAYPAVEFLTLVGLQRMRPASTTARRVFDYHTWTAPLPPVACCCVVAGESPPHGEARYRFEVGFRTDQRKHKCFMQATRIAGR
jgi:CRISPR-associated protein Csb3